MARRVHPEDLKAAVADAIVRLLAPVRAAFEANAEWQAVERLAYPEPGEAEEGPRARAVRCSRVAFSLLHRGKTVHAAAALQGQECAQTG